MSFLKIFYLSIFTFIAAACFYSPSTYAQISKSNRVEIKAGDQILDIGKHIFIYQEKSNEELTYSKVIEKHKLLQSGELQYNQIVNVGMPARPSWLIFTVNNNSTHENWVLDFGTVADGRQAFVHKLFVRNHTAKETHLRALREKDLIGSLGEKMIGSRLKIKIPANQTSLFIIYLETEGGTLANTLSPQLITDNAFLKKLSLGDNFTIIVRSFFISIMICFMAISYIRGDRRYALFTLYYFAYALLYILLSENFFAEFSHMGEAFSLTVGLTSLLAVLTSHFFLEIKRPEKRSFITLIILGIFIVFTSTINTLSFDVMSWMSMTLLLLPLIITTGAMSVLSFIQAENGKFAAHYFSAGWLLAFGGTITTILSSFAVIPATPITLNAYLFCLLPQSLFFVTAIMKKNEILETIKKRKEKRLADIEEQEARERYIQETEEQARLLRVIEREREMMAELRERESQRAEEMRVAKDAADEANRSKGAFLAVVSHEIRTPMNGILGMVRLLMDSKLSKQQHEYSIAIQQSGETMMALLNDILDFEKIETGNMVLETIDFDLHKLINGIVMLMSGHAGDKKVYLKADISPDVPTFIKGDPTRLRQVILNLVSNAIKFTDIGGVTILVSIDKQNASTRSSFNIQFAIKDTGIGISEEAQKKLFRPFEQAETSTTRKYGGTGLGLAICERLIQAMNSDIQVQSQTGKGSTFHFTLNVEAGSAERVEENMQRSVSHNRFDTPKMHILIAEDNQMNQRVLNGLLEKYGHTTNTAQNGEEALELLEDEQFDLILTDINMDGMGGVNMARAIRNLPDPGKASIPIIALTGNTRPDEIEKYFEANMNGYLAKPLNPETLAAILDDASKNIFENPVKISSGVKSAPETATKKEEAQSAVNNKEKDQKAPETTSQADKPESAEEPSISSEDIDFETTFDKHMLKNLHNSLGRDAFVDLIRGYQETADRLISGLNDTIENKDLDSMRARAHELKGMSANFGMKRISEICGDIEDQSQAGQTAEAIDNIKLLPDENEKARVGFKIWLEENNT